MPVTEKTSRRISSEKDRRSGVSSALKSSTVSKAKRPRSRSSSSSASSSASSSGSSSGSRSSSSGSSSSSVSSTSSGSSSSSASSRGSPRRAKPTGSSRALHTKRKPEPAAPAKSSRGDERRDPVPRRRSPSPHARAGRNGRDERTRSNKRSPSLRYKGNRPRASSRSRDGKSSTKRDSPNPVLHKKACGDDKDLPLNDKTLPKATQSLHFSQGEQSKATVDKKLEKEEAKKTDSASIKYQAEKESVPNTNGSKTREPAGEKKTSLEDGEIREEKKERREKVNASESSIKDLAAIETSKEVKESSKATDIALPEFTKIQVTKLSRNVTQAHIREIFSTWGQVKLVDMPADHNHPEFHRGYAYVEYTTSKAASDAVNYMNGGQIDGQEVNIMEVLSRASSARERRRSTERQLSSKRRSIDRQISPRRRHNQGRRLGHDDASLSRSRDYTVDRRGGGGAGAGYHQRSVRSPHSPVRPSRNSPFASRSAGCGENHSEVGVNRSPLHAPAQAQPTNSGGNTNPSSNEAGIKAGADNTAGSSRYRKPSPPPKRDRRSRSPLDSTRPKTTGGGESKLSEPVKDTTSRPPQRATSRGGVGGRPTMSRRRRTSTSTSSGSSSATSSASSSSSGSTSRSSSSSSRSSRSRSSTRRRGRRGGAGWRGGRRGDSRGGGRGRRGPSSRSRSRSGPLRSRR